MNLKLIFPACLSQGDIIGIVRPASTVKEEYVSKAASFLKSHGFEVKLFGQQDEKNGSFAGNAYERLRHLTEALEDRSIKAILCARGGYGAIHLLSGNLDRLIRSNPKWLIGFSDITALHSAWLHSGVVSLHAPMAKHISTEPEGDFATKTMLHILTQGLPVEYELPTHPLSKRGEAKGRIIGGNLAVFNALAETPWSLKNIIMREPSILFIEDIGENIYEVERMLFRLRLSGAIDALEGLIIGKFTEYRPDLNYDSMEAMINTFLKSGDYSLPVAFDFPIGHVRENYPIVEGSMARLSIESNRTYLKMEQ